jgi:hypothetical protein
MAHQGGIPRWAARQRRDCAGGFVSYTLGVMNVLDPVVFRELSMILKIIQDETWLESERRGCAVSASDVVVRENVCRTILKVGQQMRDLATSRSD